MNNKERISLTEAATLLGVSKETLRNWDRSGKLKSIRHPTNNYRTYNRSNVMIVKEELTEIYHADTEQPQFPAGKQTVQNLALTEDKFKKQLARLQKCLRDTDGDSSLVARFDEMTKLFFIKVLAENDDKNANLFCQLLETDDAFAERIRLFYDCACHKYLHLIPQRFRSLKLSQSAIVEASKILSSVQLTAAKVDFKGIAYEEFIRNTFDKGDNQQFFTPREIASFLVGLLNGNIRGVVGDPASGTGGFLVEIMKQGYKPKHLVALEIDDRLAWVTGINLFINGTPSFESVCLGNGGSLGPRGREYFGKFNVIITNPPFGSDYSDSNSLKNYELGKDCSSRRRGVLFVERCLDMLLDGGYLGMVIDEGVLSLPSAQDVRQLIHGRAELLAVISLPETAFMPYASVNTSIIVLRKSHAQTQLIKTFYARSEKVGRKPNGELDFVYDNSGNAISNSDLGTILKAWNEYQKNGKLAQNSENIFIANPFAQKHVDATLRLDFRYHHPARFHSYSILKKCESSLVTLSEVCTERNELYVPSLDFADQSILYTGLAQIEAHNGVAYQVAVPALSLKSSVKKYFKNDILFARMRPNLRKCHFVESAHPGYTSPECIVLTVKRDNRGHAMIDPLVLSILLRTNFVYGQIMHQVAGIGRPRLAVRDLKQIRIPLPSLEVQAKIKQTYINNQKKYSILKKRAEQLISKAKTIEKQAIEDVALGLCTL